MIKAQARTINSSAQRIGRYSWSPHVEKPSPGKAKGNLQPNRSAAGRSARQTRQAIPPIKKTARPEDRWSIFMQLFFREGSGAQGRNRTSDTRIFNPDSLTVRQALAPKSPVKPNTQNQGLSGDLSNPISEEIRDLAHLVRRIGSHRNATPETILEDKHEAADNLLSLADRLEGSR